MANEITARATLSASKDGITLSADTTFQLTLAGSGKWTNVQTIGTSTEQIAFPSDLTSEGISLLWMKNLDPTNFVSIGLNTALTQILIKLKPGQATVFPPYSGNPTIYALADTAAVNLDIVAVGT